jgi:hypothetical protein
VIGEQKAKTDKSDETSCGKIIAKQHVVSGHDFTRADSDPETFVALALRLNPSTQNELFPNLESLGPRPDSKGSFLE